MGDTIVAFYDGLGFVKVIKPGVYSPGKSDLTLVEKALEGHMEDGEMLDYFTANDLEVYVQGDYADAIHAVQRAIESGGIE